MAEQDKSTPRPDEAVVERVAKALQYAQERGFNGPQVLARAAIAATRKSACPFCTMPGGKHDDECPYDPLLELTKAKPAKQKAGNLDLSNVTRYTLADIAEAFGKDEEFVRAAWLDAALLRIAQLETTLAKLENAHG